MTIEQQALEEYLLSEPALRTASASLLADRTASADIVTQVLSQLSSKGPQELWSLIHAEAAPTAKGAAKSVSAKTAAATKGKPGTYAAHMAVLFSLPLLCWSWTCHCMTKHSTYATTLPALDSLREQAIQQSEAQSLIYGSSCVCHESDIAAYQ